MSPIIVTGLVLLGFIVSFITGYKFSLRHYSRKLIEDLYFGNVVIDLQEPQNELLSIQLDRNPKEMLENNYVLFEVKIRQ